MVRALDNFLDKITMYRLMLYYLLGLLAAAVGLSASGDLRYNPFTIIACAAILSAACWAVNRVFAAIFRVTPNSESWLITALILALIITPKLGLYDVTFLLAAAGLAMASKYILTIHNSHIFNPAAIAVVLTAVGPRQNASWWVGTAVMLPFVLAGGVLLTRKIRRGPMVLTFLVTTFLATALYTLLGPDNVVVSVKQAALASPVFFLSFVMLTEPLTSPGTTSKRRWYAALVGVLLPPQAHILNLYSSPELSLIVGNIFSYIVDPNLRLLLVLREKVRITATAVDFIFTPSKNLAYQPGQYMEWTLDHDADSRGNRRYFTLASSPTESDIRLGVKFYQLSSSYKQAMLAMARGSSITAAQVAGDFTLPKDPRRKLMFVAGGIGITPFRSMIKYLLDTNQRRDIVLLYAANDDQEIAYKEVLETARRRLGITVVYILKNTGHGMADTHIYRGSIDSELIRKIVPDYRDRLMYISGSQPLVMSVQDSLADLSVAKNHIRVDYFPGYV